MKIIFLPEILRVHLCHCEPHYRWHVNFGNLD